MGDPSSPRVGDPRGGIEGQFWIPWGYGGDQTPLKILAQLIFYLVENGPDCAFFEGVGGTTPTPQKKVAQKWFLGCPKRSLGGVREGDHYLKVLIAYIQVCVCVCVRV